MKIIISETHLDKLQEKLNELVNKYISGYIGEYLTRATFDTFIIYFLPDATNEDEYTIIEYDSDDGRLYIAKDFLLTICDMFNLKPLDVQLKINDWFINEENIYPKYVDTPRVSKHDL